jgi:hypothetical protein
MHKKTVVACVMISPPNGGVVGPADGGAPALAAGPATDGTRTEQAKNDLLGKTPCSSANRKRSGSQPKIPIPGTRTLPQKVAETKQKTLDGPMNGYTFLAGL